MFFVDNLKEVKEKEINKLSKDEINNIKFIKVMFGTESKAGTGYNYKIDEVNETDNWHPELNNSKSERGFVFDGTFSGLMLLIVSIFTCIFDTSFTGTSTKKFNAKLPLFNIVALLPFTLAIVESLFRRNPISLLAKNLSELPFSYT